MNKSLAKAILYTLLAFIIVNCSSINDIKLPENKVVYTPKPSKVNFFKDSDAETRWADSIYNKMTIEEKIGQLYFASAFSNRDSVHTNNVDKLITKYKIGGLCFFRGSLMSQAKLTNHFQAKSKIPLFISIDAEWGLSMRLDSTYRYPWNMTLGAITNPKLIQRVGEEMGKENKRMGIHFNFSPVIDINTNSKNPIIGNRSFGESKVNVAEKAIALMKGIQSQGVFCTGKHFPGHGDTSTDSHKTLPTIKFSRERIDIVDLYPYKRMFDEGLASVMVAHLSIPKYEPNKHCPTSASYEVVTNLLQKQLGFDGLIFTDGLEMKGATDYKSSGDLEIASFLAGNDIMLCPGDVPSSINKMIDAYNNNIIKEERLAYSVKKILRYKYKAGLNKYRPINTTSLNKIITPNHNDALQYKLYENIVTVLQNKDDILPIKDLSQRIAYVKLGDADHKPYLNTLRKYTSVKEVSANDMDELKNYDIVIIGFHKTDNRAWASQGFTDKEYKTIRRIAKQNRVIIDVFSKPYTLLKFKKIKHIENIEGIVLSYQNSNISQIVSAQLLFGAVEARGKLPVSINDVFSVGSGLTTRKLNRLGFSLPENEGMNPIKLAEIDLLAQKAIDGEMTPGLQVLVARNGNVIFQKAYGYHTYDNSEAVTDTDIYDLASITKMAATLPNVMQLYDQKKIDLSSKLADIDPYFANTNKQDILFKDLMTHSAGLTAWIPFYKATLDSLQKPSPVYYRAIKDSTFSVKVADSIFMRKDYCDTIMSIISKSDLSPIKEYKYSDLTFFILKDYLERTTNKSLDVLAQDNFYKSMGMNYTTFNPLQRFERKEIVPTEIDNYFRYQTIHGYVHDMGAAMLGGVSGHAGLFSNAMDVAKLMQMFLQKGTYGDITYFSPQTFDDFNTCYYCAEGNRRGLGFDKPQLLNEEYPTCNCVSKSSFGHTGFTGNIAWADPETNIVYVFLSNRTYQKTPTDTNKLGNAHIREDIQRVIQESIIDHSSINDNL